METLMGGGAAGATAAGAAAQGSMWQDLMGSMVQAGQQPPGQAAGDMLNMQDGAFKDLANMGQTGQPLHQAPNKSGGEDPWASLLGLMNDSNGKQSNSLF